RTCRFVRGDLAVELHVERLRTATGPVAVVIAHEVSGELQSLARRARDREARLHEERMHAMGVVASGLAHDLNHSLNVIALRIATLRADPRFEPVRRALDALVRVVDEAAATVARLQDLARRRRDRPAESVDLTAVLLGAIAYGRMHGLGGSTSASNRARGGSMFTLRFPLAAAPQHREARHEGTRRQSRVLLIDDEIDNLEVLQELLELEGHRVDAAASG